MAVLVLLSVVASGATVATAQDSAPGEPANFYGEVADEQGNTAPAETTIVAVVNGEVEGEITIETAGEYGGEGAFEEKLSLDSNAGETVAFHVNNPAGPRAHTRPLEAGTFQENLTFPAGTFDAGSSTPPTETPTDRDDASDGTDASGDSRNTSDDNATAAPIPETAETVDVEDADPDAPGTTVQFENTTIDEIVFSNETATGEVSITEYNDTVETSPPGNYRLATSTRIEVPEALENQSATIRATISQAELDERGLSADNLTMFRMPDGAEDWEQLNTNVTKTDDGYVLEAVTPGFSQFIIASQPANDTATSPTPTDTATTTPTDETPMSTTEDEDDSTSVIGPSPLVGGLLLLVALSSLTGYYLFARD